jgi:hypothetical protein
LEEEHDNDDDVKDAPDGDSNDNEMEDEEV